MDSGADLNEDNPAQFWSTTVYGRLSRFCDAERHGSAELCASVRQALRAERAAMEAELRTLDLRIFALSPAHPSRLPPEILVHIFSYLFAVRTDLSCYSTKHLQLAIEQSARVTHVCQRWREVALGAPLLWRNIIVPLKSEEWSRTIYNRAQLVPIVLFWLRQKEWSLAPGQRQAPPLPIEDLARVEQLKLASYDGEADALAKLLRTPAPILEVAEVFCQHVDMSPADLFAGHAPRLRSLFLNQFPSFPWNSPILSNLVCLEIRNDRMNVAGHASPDSVLHALQKMPALEALALCNCLPKFPRDSAVLEALIVVPSRLRLLELHGSLRDCVGFCQHLIFPAAGINLALRCFTWGVATGFRVLWPIIVAAGGVSPAPFVAFDFSMQSSEYLALMAQRTAARGAAPLPKFAWGTSNHSLELDLEWNHRVGWNAVDLMRELCKTLSVQGLRKLDVDIADAPPGARTQEVTVNDWLEIFGSATDLRDVQAWGFAAQWLCRALLMVTDDGQTWHSILRRPSHPWDFFFLPKMHTLRLGGITEELCYVFPEEGLQLGDLLVLALRTRAENGAPVRDLELSHATHALEDELPDVVDSVYVDEYASPRDEEVRFGVREPDANE
ncbi:hypothetical protein BV25DRAFT_762979 [Artomyces pyxidatus]|uniref:Uncharacterized protein n=1 Tax=Artomyces pyxidatus TaxID=48021 RepID=A0ACB8SYM3_9AGAM|nr:hypothetical protein BV25DRAFT_762979 [Artomyces pyxidatus]